MGGTLAVVAVSSSTVAGQAVQGEGVAGTGGGEARAVFLQVAVPRFGSADAACRFQLQSGERRRRSGREEHPDGPLRQRLAGWFGTDSAVVAALSGCTLGARSQSAGGGVAAGVLAFLQADRGRAEAPALRDVGMSLRT